MSNEFKLVPVEPTDDMVVAFAEVWYSKRQAYDDPDMSDAYAAMLAAAPQPPALGGEPDAYFADINDPDETGTDKPDFRTVILLREHRAHLATLQAEIERLNSLHDVDTEAMRLLSAEDDQLKAEIERLKEESFEELYNAAIDERDQLKARRDELEGLLREVAALDPRGEFMGWQLDGRIDAALSKPAGSEKL